MAMMVDDDEEIDVEARCAARFADVEHEDGQVRGPLAGLFPASLPVPSLEDALSSIAEILPIFAPGSKQVKLAQRKAKQTQKQYNFMTLDEIASIVLYTMEANPREQSLYFAMNKALRDMDRTGVKPWRDYIWLLMNSLKKLPASKIMNVVRGAKCPFDKIGMDLSAGDEFSWASFSSVTTTIEVMQTFLGDQGDRTMIQIQLCESIARDIKDFSFFPSENELLLPPNISFEFTSKFNAGNGITIVQAKQIESLDSILDISTPDEGHVATGSGAKAAMALKPKTTSAPTIAPEVRKFLEEASVAEFADAFVQAGFDSVDLLHDLTEDDLKELGLQLGHRKKFLKAVAAKSAASNAAAEKAAAEKAAAEKEAKEEAEREAIEFFAAKEKQAKEKAAAEKAAAEKAAAEKAAAEKAAAERARAAAEKAAAEKVAAEKAAAEAKAKAAATAVKYYKVVTSSSAHNFRNAKSKSAGKVFCASPGNNFVRGVQEGDWLRLIDMNDVYSLMREGSDVFLSEVSGATPEVIRGWRCVTSAAAHNIRSGKSKSTARVRQVGPGDMIYGTREDDWVRLADGTGYSLIGAGGDIFLDLSM